MLWNHTLLPSAQGNIFTSVCHSVHRRGVCTSACWDTHPRVRQPPQADTPRQTSPRQTPPGQTPPLCSLLLLSALLLLALLALVLSSPSSAGTAFEHSFKDRNFNFCGYVPTDVHQILLFKNLVEFLYSKLFLSNMCIDSFFKCTDFKFAINKIIEGA